MSNKKYKKEIQALLDEIIIDAYGDIEQLWAFHQAFEDNIPVPADVFIMGLPCILIDIEYDGNERRGLTANCKRDDGSEHEVPVAEIVFPQGSIGVLYVDAYRQWMGLEPIPPVKIPGSSRKILKHKAQAEDIDVKGPVDLIVVSVKQNAARCCILDNNRIITLKASQL